MKENLSKDLDITRKNHPPLRKEAMKMLSRQIVLYGLAGANNSYRIVRYRIIHEEDISIWFMIRAAYAMREEYPLVEEVHAVDNKPGLNKMFLETLKVPSVENCVCFRTFLEQEGLKII